MVPEIRSGDKKMTDAQLKTVQTRWEELQKADDKTLQTLGLKRENGIVVDSQGWWVLGLPVKE